MAPNEAGGCGFDLELLSIDGAMLDALRTRYEYGLNASTLGGVTIKRIETDPNWLELQGYKEPVYCTDAVCQDLQVGTTYWISESTVFKLVDIDGNRTIELVQL